ncbi:MULTISPECIES: GNAT family N-acetyltransferase [unclassified Streptomyces]|uniref:GNAT family N-acetyltransferase n=1 Tax=unclassified Streptomyces TaxID=2593676 RepID=UPI00381C2A2B
MCVAVDGVPRSARLDLLPLRAGHADEMARVLSDPALHAFIGGRPETLDELRARYRRVLAGSPDPAVSWLTWVLRLRDEGCLTGYVQATLSPGAAGPEAEIAWVVGTPWQGRGLAGEAARALTGWLDSRGVRTVVAHIHPDHRASASVARACGLAPTGHWQDGERRWQRDVPDGVPETA